MRWDQNNIIEAIRQLHRESADLSFNAAQENHLGLMRAAALHYGSWKCAIESAGLDYAQISRYRRWTRARVLTAIRDHHRAGRDLSWRSVSHALDPSLAAAALRPGVGFETWRDAVSAAGLSPDQTARYQHWTPERVIDEIQRLAAQNQPLSSQRVQRSNPPLFCAARRRFKTWNGALEAAGIDPDTVNLRRKTRVQSVEIAPSETGKSSRKARKTAPTRA